MAVSWTTQRTGNWSLDSTNASSPWYDGGTQTGYARTPGSSSNANNDLVTIANGHTLTCDASVTIGDATTPASLALRTAGTGGTGVLSVSAGVTLTIVSNVQHAATWTFAAGSGLTFNSSTILTWQVSDANNQANAKLKCQGSSGSHCTVTSSGAAKGKFTYLGTLASHDHTYTDFSNLGDSSNDAIRYNLNGSNNGTFSLDNCTFTTCGQVTVLTGMTAASVCSVTNCTWASTANSGYCLTVNATTSLSGGTRLVQNNVFDKGFQNAQHSRDFTIIGNFVGALPGWSVAADHPLAANYSNLWVHNSNAAAVNVPSNFSNYANGWNYYHIHSSSAQLTNVHGPTFPAAATSIECSGIIFDPGNTDERGDLVLPPTSTTAGSTMNARYLLVLPVATGTQASNSVGKLCAFLGTYANLVTTADHNTICSTGTSECGVVQWGETNKGLVGMVTSCRSNLAWTPSGKTAGMKVQKNSTGSGLAGTASVTNGSATVTGSGTSWSSQLIAGDWIQVTVDTTPYKIQSVDSNTQLTLTTTYGGTTNGSRTIRPYVQDAIYNAGYTAANYNAGWGLGTGTDTKGYNSDLSGGKAFSYTPGANDVSLSSDPFVDSTRNIATWAVSLSLASSGDTYQQKVDAAYTYLKADPASRIAALVAYVKAGFNVTAASLNGAGHDGVTIGALPYSPAGPTDPVFPNMSACCTMP